MWALNLGANPDSAALSPCPWATDLSLNLSFLTCHKAIVTVNAQLSNAREQVIPLCMQTSAPQTSPGCLLNAPFDAAGLGWRLSFCISNKGTPKLQVRGRHFE